MSENKLPPINLRDVFNKLWPHRKKYFYIMPATLIVSYLIIVCVPRYYTSTTLLAPEATGMNMSGTMGSLASSVGLGSLMKMSSQDAISAEIYPDVISSADFIANLMTEQVYTKKKDVECSYYVYLRDHQKDAWWNNIISYLISLVKPVEKDSYQGQDVISVFSLTKRQSEIFESAKGLINCRVDKKTDVVSITVKDQDPVVAALIANATSKRLQEFIVAYRTNKARIDYEYYKKLAAETKEEYQQAQKRYSSYSDAHSDLVLVSYKSKLDQLENEMQLKQQLYTAMNTQMQQAAAKLQEATPAFTVIESASVPIKPAGPKRMIISIAMMILSFFVYSGWLLYKHK